MNATPASSTRVGRRAASGTLAWPFVMLAINGVGTGLVFSVNRIAAVAGVPFIAYVFWAALLAGATLLLIGLSLGMLPPLTFRHLRVYAIMGATGVAVPMTVFAFVAPRMPASVLSLGLILTPMITYALALPIGLERFRARSLAGIVLGFAGVLLVVLPETSLPERSMVGWVLLALIGPTSFAVSNVCAAALRPPQTPSLVMGAGMPLFAALLLLPAMVAEGDWWFFDAGLDRGGAMVLAFGAMLALLFVLMFEMVRLKGPVFFSTGNYIAPIAGVVFAMIIFGESLSPWLWAALAFMLAGLATMNTRRRPAPFADASARRAGPPGQALDP